MEPLFKKDTFVGFIVNKLTSTPFAVQQYDIINSGETGFHQYIQLARVAGVDELNPDCVIVSYGDSLRVMSAKNLFNIIPNK